MTPVWSSSRFTSSRLHVFTSSREPDAEQVPEKPMLIDSPYLVPPGKPFDLSDIKTDDRGPFEDKDDAVGPTDKNVKRLDALQEMLYAQGKYAVLIVLQAMDAGGKDGAIEH